jgi:MFS family permease
LDLPGKVGTISVALMNLARVPGQISIGYISDRLGARVLIIAMAGASGLSVMTGWGLARDTGGILGFAIAFGGFAGSYTALFPRCVAAAAEIVHVELTEKIYLHHLSFVAPVRMMNSADFNLEDDPHLHMMLYALFSFARGIGSIASGPLSTALLGHSTAVEMGSKGWGGLILWTGIVLLGSGVGAGYRSAKA